MLEHVTHPCTCPGKWCPGCEQNMCYSAFGPNKARKDGLQSYCRKCFSVKHATFRQKNLEHVRESTRVRIRKSREASRQAKIRLERTIEFDHAVDACICRGKRCPCCKQTKCVSFFNADQCSKSGLHSHCRECYNLKSRAYRQKDLEHYRVLERAYARKRREAHPEYSRTWRQNNAEYMRIYHQMYREANRERLNAYREANADKFREQSRAYNKTHREQRAIHEEKRRARKVQAGGSFTRQEWEELCFYYDYTCLRCGKQVPHIELTVDHVVPLSQGGTNGIDNLQPLCRSCNSSKRTKVIDYRQK